MLPWYREVVAAEIADAPEPVREVYAEPLQLGAELLRVQEAVLSLADAYQQRGILSPKYYDDGLHIALATAARVDVLVSGNFRHVVHHDRIRLFNAVNLELGYPTLQIYSPREVTHYGEDAD